MHDDKDKNNHQDTKILRYPLWYETNLWFSDYMTIQKINMPKARISLLVRGSIPAVVTTLIGIQLGFFIEQAVSPADRTSVNQCFLAFGFVDLIMSLLHRVLWESILLWVCYWFVEPPGEHHSHYWHFPTVFPSIVLISPVMWKNIPVMNVQ